MLYLASSRRLRVPAPIGPKAKAKLSQGKHLLPQASLTRTDDSLRAVGHLQLAEDARNIIAHRRIASEGKLSHIGR